MKTVSDLIARDLGRKIEEIIKVDQTDEHAVYAEVTEYVATDRIKEQYRDLLKAIAEAPADPHEGIGVWISGFFGSGKSSFAKNLGYTLANRPVLGHKAGALFKAQVGDQRIGQLVDFINARIPTEVIMFDVSVDRAVKKATERIAEIMYTVLLRELDYAEDYDVAELEIELESEGKLSEFISRCQAKYGEWRMVRKGAQKISRASSILNLMDSATYPTPDSWAVSLGSKAADITVGKFVERTFDLCARRRSGKGLVFVVDEVGQYVARSADKIEDLRAVVEQFGKVSRNLVAARKAVAPVWVVVTSQEKLDEVVAAIDSKRVELAKLQDRFKYRVDLAPSDIRDVATRRVLAKKDEAGPVLRTLFERHQGQLNAAVRLERTMRRSEVTEDEFVQFYPYPPHFIELSIDIVSGIRLQPGAPKHYGGSNRTIIKQAYEMLVSERTSLAKKPVGTLVTLDRIYELVEGNLSSEKQKDLNDIVQRFKGDPEDRGMTARVAKAVCLLEFVRDLPRTEANIAACLVDEVGAPAPRAAVAAALRRLQEAQFVRNTEQGWKLQTAQEKNWETERRGYLAPKPRDRNETIRGAIQEVFGDPKLKTYRYRNLRTFPVGLLVDGVRLGNEELVSLSIHTAEDNAAFPAKLEEVRVESRQENHKHDIYWVMALSPEIDALVADQFASKEMVKKYDQLRAQNRISADEAACLASENTEIATRQRTLRDKLTATFEQGQGVFRGVSKDAASLGKSIGEICKKLLDFAVPYLYPKLEMGARPIKGTEADEILRAANLNGLSQVFYGGDESLNLVVKEGPGYVVNPNADLVKEILDYLVREQANGNRETRVGKALESHFGGLGYGWERDMLRLVLATLFRAGAIDVRYDGKLYESYLDAAARAPFTNNTTFRGALFTPAKRIDLATLKKAVLSYEELTGQTVDMEKGAISTALKKLAEEEAKLLVAVQAQAQASRLPGPAAIDDYQTTLKGIQTGGADECVRILAGEGRSLKDERDRMKRLRAVVQDKQAMSAITQARAVVNDMWPVLEARGTNGDLSAKAAELKELLASATFYDSMADIKAKSQALGTVYADAYSKQHDRRAKLYEQAVDAVKGMPEWLEVPPEMQGPVLASLTGRACQDLDLHHGATTCGKCRATLSEMESDEAAVDSLKAKVVARVLELTAPEQEPEPEPGTTPTTTRVRVVEFFSDALTSEEAVNDAVERLREHLLALWRSGTRIEVE